MKSLHVFAAVVAVILGVPFAMAFPTGESGAPPPARHGSAAAPVAPVGKIPKATDADGKTVAEVVTGKDALKGKTVTIHGQVVKAAHGILGKTWIHLQDGSGSPAASTHDIVVTTTDEVAVGDVVYAKGTVQTNVDIGSGYKYAVLVEGVKVRK